MTDQVSTLLMFGATGDLARRMLWPSLYGLHHDKLLDATLRLVGTARSELDTAAFRDQVVDALKEHLPAEFYDEATARAFVQRIDYLAMDATDPAAADKLGALARDYPGKIAVFLSTAPSLFKQTIERLVAAGLSGEGVRLALEKPLGTSLASSNEINDAVAAAFPESHIFRIDHYLGKETVQNLLALRFANAIFEPLWNARTIDHVQITIAETIGLEGRADYYDGTGALRDMVQNHMLQLLALVAMEPPASFNADAVRNEKVKILQSLRPIAQDRVESDLVIGQYVEGEIGGQRAASYVSELGGPSMTETFIAMKVNIDNWRWAGVPFYLRTGKRLSSRRTEIVIQFKKVPHSMFEAGGAHATSNRLIISIQPEEDITLELMAKVPGLDFGGMRLREVELGIGRADAFADVRRRIAYERLLLDLIDGNSLLFVRRDEVEAQWRWIDALRVSLAASGIRPQPYAAGSWGPPAAKALVGRHGVDWND
ncbi:glucose-6-phosphate dehydrogenase [Sphingomonas sabuli]|nr:glucose-6-phosphate dehydrogenase [Sphingomonas sabuli]